MPVRTDFKFLQSGDGSLLVDAIERLLTGRGTTVLQISSSGPELERDALFRSAKVVGKQLMIETTKGTRSFGSPHVTIDEEMVHIAIRNRATIDTFYIPTR